MTGGLVLSTALRAEVEFTRPAEFGDRYVWNPAADDVRLARACIDLKAGLHRAAGEVLAESRGAAGPGSGAGQGSGSRSGSRSGLVDSALRAHRSLVLAAAAADSDTAEQWAARDPGPDALLLLARTAAARALRAADRGDWRAARLAEIAAAGCERAAVAAPGDPVPLVVKLSLARLSTAPDTASACEHGRAAARAALLDAAHDLFRQITEIDPGNREAHHRLLALHFARHGGSAAEMWQAAWWIADRVAQDSELALLPFVALAEDARERPAESGPWADPDWRRAAVAVYRSWFPRVAREYRFTPVVDLSCLGHALAMARLSEARHVLGAMGPFATTVPWDLHGNPVAALTEARRRLGLRVPVL
jgi:hypothetical protein